jgi:hypothetical protein
MFFSIKVNIKNNKKLLRNSNYCANINPCLTKKTGRANLAYALACSQQHVTGSSTLTVYGLKQLVGTAANGFNPCPHYNN